MAIGPGVRPPARVLAGTSGYQYTAWRGVFYPERCREADMLECYASRLRTVELNNTFYRMPKAATLAGWAARVPEGFVFAVKAPQRITHRQRLSDCGESVAFLVQNLKQLGTRMGPLLFQLPPNLRLDMDRLSAFLDLLPAGLRVAFEFRHDSWRDERVLAALTERNIALCIADVDGIELGAGWQATADFGYLRLRRDHYDGEMLSSLAQRVRAEAWQVTFAYFKHEESGPRLAQAFTTLFPE